MKRIVLSITLLIIFVNPKTTNSQAGSVGLGTSNPNPNASLKLASASKGFLLNRVSFSATNIPAPLTAHVEGMLIYNTATAGTTPGNVFPGLVITNRNESKKFTITYSMLSMA